MLNSHADTIKHIFEMSMKGLGCTLITQKLNAEGVKTLKRGKEWSDMAVFNILKNKAAYGCLTYDKKTKEKEDFFPSVITKDEFYQSQAVVSSRRTMNTTRTSKEVTYTRVDLSSTNMRPIYHSSRGWKL